MLFCLFADQFFQFHSITVLHYSKSETSRIVNSPHSRVQDELLLEEWYPEICTKWHTPTPKSSIGSSGPRSWIFLTIEKTASMWWTVAGDMCRLCAHSILSAFVLSGWSGLLDALGFSVAALQATGLPVTASSWLQVSDPERSTFPDSSFVATGFSVAVSINPPEYASCSRTWELYVASDFEFLLILLLGFAVAISIPGLLDAIGLFADEELAGTCEDRFIAMQISILPRFFLLPSVPASSSPSFWSSFIKLEFSAQQVELKMADVERRRLFHSSRVKLPLVKMSASGCLVFLESRLILSNNHSRATMWVWTHVSLRDYGLSLSF